MRRHFIFTLTISFSLLLATSAFAQLIPSPSANRQLYIRNNNGKVIERLSPRLNQYDVFDMRRGTTPIGVAKILGQRLIIYDLNNHMMASVRAELLPPDSNLAIISIVRDRNGHPIGMLERY